MFLNTIAPAEGATRDRRRVGRGTGSGLGKMGGRGHKGQKSRSGGFHKVGFEGGQTALQMRLPKVGFVSQKSKFVSEVRLDVLAKLEVTEITLETLKENNLVNKSIKEVKVINSGELTKAIHISGLRFTAGAKQAIESAGGSVKE